MEHDRGSTRQALTDVVRFAGSTAHSSTHRKLVQLKLVLPRSTVISRLDAAGLLPADADTSVDSVLIAPLLLASSPKAVVLSPSAATT